MFNSGMTVANFITALNSEVDISQTISDSTILRWVSSLEQLLYDDIIRFEKGQDVTDDLDNDAFLFSDLDIGANEQAPDFGDVLKVFCDGVELTKSGPIAGFQFHTDKQIYCETSGGIKIYPFDSPAEVYVMWRVKPKIKTATSEYIYMPYEWIDLVFAKLRGECYKLANDDSQAAKWLADYNAQLESFKVWVEEHQKRFGE